MILDLLTPTQLAFFEDILQTLEQCCINKDFSNLPYGKNINHLILNYKTIPTDEWIQRIVDCIIREDY